MKAPGNAWRRSAALIGWVWLATLTTPAAARTQSAESASLPAKRLPLLVTPSPEATWPVAPFRRRVTDFARPFAVVLLGATWCKPCGPLYDSVSATATRLHGGRHGFAYVSFDDDPWKVWRSVRLSGGIRVPILFEGDHLSALEEWGVTGVPWLFVIDSTGQVLERGVGTEPGLAILRRIEADSGGQW